MEFKVLNNKLYRNLQRDDTKVGLSQRIDLITGLTPKKIKKPGRSKAFRTSNAKVTTGPK